MNPYLFLFLITKIISSIKKRKADITKNRRQVLEKSKQKSFNIKPPEQTKALYSNKISQENLSQSDVLISIINLEDNNLIKDILIVTFLRKLKNTYFNVHSDDYLPQFWHYDSDLETDNWVTEHFSELDIITVLDLHRLKASVKNTFDIPIELSSVIEEITNMFKYFKDHNKTSVIVKSSDFKLAIKKIFDLFFTQKFKYINKKKTTVYEPNINLIPLLFLSTEINVIVYRIFFNLKTNLEPKADTNQKSNVFISSIDNISSKIINLLCIFDLEPVFESFVEGTSNKYVEPENTRFNDSFVVDRKSPVIINDFIDIKAELNNILDTYNSLSEMITREFIRESKKMKITYEDFETGFYLDIIRESDQIKNIIESLLKIERFFQRKIMKVSKK